MLFLLENNLVLYGILFTGLVGIVSRIRLSNVCRILSREVDNMGASSHELLMFIKKKYENSLLLNREVKNTDVFVEKHLRKYQVGKITLKGLEAITYEMMLCGLILGCVGGLGAYFENMTLQRIIIYPATSGLMVLLLLFCQSFLEIDSRLEYTRLSIVDYLENTMQNRITLMEEKRERLPREAAISKEEKQVEFLSDSMEDFPLDFTWDSSEDEALVRQVVEEFFS